MNKKRRLGNTDLDVSEIGLGGWQLVTRNLNNMKNQNMHLKILWKLSKKIVSGEKNLLSTSF
jgi:aryl-alcohol dehydrogenase-like predicted oxidoreductase